ncbi:hypothetical protein BWO91_19160 [Plantibacter flavus]|nr:hypothetical protein BWO91_19160 [Plantibacter flavus]
MLARMRELADSRTAWHRGLWQPGTLVLLDEVIEAVLATWDGSLTSDEAMKDIINTTMTQVLRDPGVGDQTVREALHELLRQLRPSGNAKSKPTPDLQQLLDRTVALAARSRTGYVLRWIEHVESVGIAPEQVELASRLLVAHLLDEGFHRNHVHGWLVAQGRKVELAAVLRRGREMLVQSRRTFTFCVGVVRAPLEVREALKEHWLDSDTYTKRFRAANNPKRRPVPRAGAGAIEWSAEARDPHAAMYELLEWQQKLVARVQLGYGQGDKIEFEADVIDATANKIRTPLEDRRSIRVPAIQRSRLFVGGADSGQRLDGAIGLLASHSGEIRGASIASVWAAAEGLLGRPGGKGTDVADRLSDIITCSFPRAEVGDLARAWADHGSGELFDALQGLPSADQARLMAEHLANAGDPGFESAADRAAAARYIQLAADPVGVLERVRNYYNSVCRRLYYHRNFIMHAAKFDSVTLGVSVRTAPVLVAAALDRVVNAEQGKNPVSPLALAARAQNELSLVGTTGARPLHLLLD